MAAGRAVEGSARGAMGSQDDALNTHGRSQERSLSHLPVCHSLSFKHPFVVRPRRGIPAPSVDLSAPDPIPGERGHLWLPGSSAHQYPSSPLPPARHPFPASAGIPLLWLRRRPFSPPVGWSQKIAQMSNAPWTLLRQAEWIFPPSSRHASILACSTADCLDERILPSCLLRTMPFEPEFGHLWRCCSIGPNLKGKVLTWAGEGYTGPRPALLRGIKFSSFPLTYETFLGLILLCRSASHLCLCPPISGLWPSWQKLEWSPGRWGSHSLWVCPPGLTGRAGA